MHPRFLFPELTQKGGGVRFGQKRGQCIEKDQIITAVVAAVCGTPSLVSVAMQNGADAQKTIDGIKGIGGGSFSVAGISIPGAQPYHCVFGKSCARSQAFRTFDIRLRFGDENFTSTGAGRIKLYFQSRMPGLKPCGLARIIQQCPEGAPVAAVGVIKGFG